ncbi:MAG: hypothetical protein ACHP65_07385 [Legionellales bacterium]
MINFNPLKWGRVTIIPLVLSLSSCYINDQYAPGPDNVIPAKPVVWANAEQCQRACPCN